MGVWDLEWVGLDGWDGWDGWDGSVCTLNYIFLLVSSFLRMRLNGVFLLQSFIIETIIETTTAAAAATYTTSTCTVGATACVAVYVCLCWSCFLLECFV